MTRQHDVHTPAVNFRGAACCNRIGLDALRALDALEEQLFGMSLERIVTAEAINTKRQRLTKQDSPVD